MPQEGYGSDMAGFQVRGSAWDGTTWIRHEADAGGRTDASWRRRLRYWLNSFRGFAVFDVRGIDPR